MKVFKFVFVCTMWCGIFAQDPWTLQRTEMDESHIVFKNTTITSKIMISSWSWRDSLAGMWDTRLRVSLANNSFQSGHMDYRDGYGNEILRVRWQQTPHTNLTWKALFVSKFPPTSWNMSSNFLNWGYKPTSETTWLFYVGESSFEPKPNGKVVYNPLEDVLGIWLRKKRSVQRTKRSASHQQNKPSAFNLMDLFMGDGIFAFVPQLFINIFTFFSGLFPPQDDEEYQSDGSISTEADAEIMPTTKAPSDKLITHAKSRRL